MRYLVTLIFIVTAIFACPDCGEKYYDCNHKHTLTFSEPSLQINEAVKYSVQKSCCSSTTNNKKCCRNDYYKITNLTAGKYIFEFAASNDNKNKLTVKIGTSCNGTDLLNTTFKRETTKIIEIENESIFLRIQAVNGEGLTDYSVKITKVVEPELSKNVNVTSPHQNDEVTFTISIKNRSSTDHQLEIRDWLEVDNDELGTTANAFEIVSHRVVEGDASCEIWEDEDTRSVYCSTNDKAHQGEGFKVEIDAKVIKTGNVKNRVYSYVDGENGPLAEVSLDVKPARAIEDHTYNLCQIFKSGINTPQFVLEAQNSAQCNLMSINVETQPEDKLLCTTDCNTSAQECSLAETPSFFDEVVFYESERSTSAPENYRFTQNDYQNAQYTLTSNQTFYFAAATKYQNSGRKYMLLDNLEINGDDHEIILEFEPGDYFFNNITITNGHITIRPKSSGSVRIFVQHNFIIDNSTLIIDTDGKPEQLVIFSGNEFKYTMKTQDSSCSFFDPACWMSWFGSSEECERKVQIESYIYAQNRLDIDAYCTNLVGGLAGKNSIKLKSNNFHIFYIAPTNCRSYCAEMQLSEGFHIIDPDGGDNSNAFEIYCDMSSQYAPRDLLALPNKNDFNNFVYTKDRLDSKDYYQEALDNSIGFDAIQIYAKTLQVITDPDQKDPIETNGYRVMGSAFSNINLIGTPFGIDWGNTSLTHCDTDKLRKAYYGQAVKINTLDYSNARCFIDSMKLKLIPGYRYLEWRGNEILEKTCKEMSEAVPENILPSDQIKGFYWIDPFKKGRNSYTSIKDITRPYVVYCWFQTDLDYAWTYYLALDGMRTHHKRDLIEKKDTCSRKGLWPFVPNNEKTFERVRKFLYEQKDQWINYTGTIQEKIEALTGATYYLASERDAPIWPYGSFGVYYDNFNGHHSTSVRNEETPGKWYDGDTKSATYMAGAPMHNCKDITEDYPEFHDGDGRVYYHWSKTSKIRYSSTDNDSRAGHYKYEDTMGAKGWRSILQDLNKTDQWFISRTGAGLNFKQTSSWPYFEPNGNYEEGAWLNFLYDSLGRVRHLDDAGSIYPYYDYMCMAEDNYDFVNRYSLVPGPFTVVDRNISSEEVLNKKIITTKVINAPLELDLVLFNKEMTAVSDNNISFGLFLCKTHFEGEQEIKDFVRFIGQKRDFNTASGRTQLDLNPITEAHKRMFFEFLYCGRDDYEWTDCYETNGTCKSGQEQWCKVADSDDFAIRPKKFALGTIPMPLIAGVDHNITVKALDFTGAAAAGYNETLSTTQSPKVEYNITKPHCFLGNLNLTYGNFQNGIADTRISFDEVGKVYIRVFEENGSEFAAIDSDDTPLDQRLIEEVNQTLVYIPDHFEIVATYQNYRNNAFTYISSDLTVASELNVTVKAKNYQDTITKNYNTQCYSKDHSFTLTHSAIPQKVQNILFYLIDQRGNVGAIQTISTDQNITFGYAKENFTTDVNGTSKFQTFINFSRENNNAINPFTFTVMDINTTDSDDVNGSLALNQNAQFYYGRLHIPSQRIEGSQGDVKAYYEIYIDDSGTDPAGIRGKASIDDVDWFVNTAHVGNDGNITTPLNSNVDSKIKLTGLATINSGEQNLTLQYTDQVYPYAKTFGLDTHSWLLYDRYDSSITKAFGRVTFKRAGDWLGRGKDFSGDSEIAPSKNENRKILW